jgi:hypothetical protein
MALVRLPRAARMHRGVSMNRSFLKGAAVGLTCGVLGGAAVALAGSGVGGVFNLGVSNSVDAKSTLTGATPGVQLQVTNTNNTAGAFGLAVNSVGGTATGIFTNTGTGRALSAQTSAAASAFFASNTGGGPAGVFTVNAGLSPFTVNSATKVKNLNADLLDGVDSTALQKRVTGTCAAGSSIRVVNVSGTVLCQSGGAGGGGVIAGVVTFVDPLDAAGFIGVGGEQNLTSSAGDAASPVTYAGTVGGFTARLPAAAVGDVVFTLFVNGAATPVTCTIAATQTGCTDASHTTPISIGDTVAVGLTNGSGLLRHVRWAASLE